MTERIVIAGASGFMGRRFRERFEAEGAEVRTVGRALSGADAAWGDEAGIRALVEGSDLLLNLAGKSVNCRYNAANRAEIFRSRLETTAELGRVVQAADAPPPVWMNASTATIYRHADDRPMTESTGEIGTGFSVDVATSWERTLAEHAREGVRQVALRMAITLGDGSALRPLVNLARLGLGGPHIGGKTPGGRQRFSWVHLDDVHRAIRFLQTSELDGAVNISSPNPSTDREVMATIRRVLGVPVGVPLSGWMLELGSAVIRTETELILKSRWVLPERLEAAGFRFAHPELEPALREILGRPAPSRG
ncbi:TIGR01777 family oxidoreductase [Homoserinibacter sp. YIM 151385]|uniref:TIGR01777 family oxidoreductase n=1 Tax=Homoserinibacter sp. YIM 151385 TaxID=2985506 RepID=UPI0022F0DCB3|nr:TIGR01777 family oxidoreductase [Homoserinibacter sp. YIM 151385]WBU38941.1 TIGR01777 family oxidoreductase [Homoserinibacter sp. YIM 151385]